MLGRIAEVSLDETLDQVEKDAEGSVVNSRDGALEDIASEGLRNPSKRWRKREASQAGPSFISKLSSPQELGIT